MGNLSTFFPVASSTNVLEQLSFDCDGQTISTSQGNITAPNCTATQNVTSTSMADVTNSTVAYQPPSNATKVVIEYRFLQNHDRAGNYYTLGSMQANVDGTDVNTSRLQWFDYGYSSYERSSQTRNIRVEIKINGTEALASGTMGTWNSSKNIKIRAACYHASTYNYYLHLTDYWLNTGTEYFVVPSYKITAYS
mgnify:CR=1 FL=1|tara:strand:+ start:1140 stop:1721 length:582 start_codon:yes stop_codon:yes gene_type:complete